MASVSSDSANWRLFGGGGMALGGLIWLVGALIGEIPGAGTAGTSIAVFGTIVVGAAVFFVAFGQTGSNGAVGASLPGKVALSALGLGWMLYAAGLIVGGFGVVVPVVLMWVVAGFTVVGGIGAASVIVSRGVARGAAAWFLFLPAGWSVLFWVPAFVPLPFDAWWLNAVLALLFTVTGLLYLVNRKHLD